MHPDTELLLIRFYNGASMLTLIAADAFVVTDQATALEEILSFENAYEALVNLHALGKIEAGAADFSVVNLERVKRLCLLLRKRIENTEAQNVADETRRLAEQVLKGLLSQTPSSPA